MGHVRSLRRIGAVILFASATWIVWPFVRPYFYPPGDKDLIVVLDGYHRLDRAIDRQVLTKSAILLVTCPLTGQPNESQSARRKGSLNVLEGGVDTAEQAKKVADWFSARSWRSKNAPGKVILMTDPHHFPRASLAFQLALGGFGVRVVPVKTSLGMERPLSDLTIWRDFFRLQAWRLTGSTWGYLDPSRFRKKVNSCLASA